MSTRCQIGFYEDADQSIHEPSALLYRHSDGYPGPPVGDPRFTNGVLPDILPFLKTFDERRGLDDVQYAAAWLLWHLIERHRQMVAKSAQEFDSAPPDGIDFLGYGICDGFHGDIQFFYRIDCDTKVISVYECGAEGHPEWRSGMVSIVDVNSWGKEPPDEQRKTSVADEKG